mgnify:CR=1 FL=1
MMRKASLSMNAIVIAALVLIVLIVIHVLLSGKLGSFGKRVSGCEAQGGVCRTECEAGEMAIPNTDCTPELGGKLCCASVK